MLIRVNSSVVFVSSTKYFLASFSLFVLVLVVIVTHRNTRDGLQSGTNIAALSTGSPHSQSSEKEAGAQEYGSNPGVHIREGVCSKGMPPWTNEWLLTQLTPFLEVYDKRPADNRLGSPLMHQFALWCMVRHLQPKQIIESGVWAGLGTWILRQAAPEAQLILVDPKLQKHMHYIDEKNNTIYLTNKNFRDLSGFRNWNDITFDLENTLVFVDDHFTPFQRIPHARRMGFKHMIFEDNYWLGFSDCFSLKQGCGCLMNDPECKEFKYQGAWGTSKRNLTKEDMKLVARTFEGIDKYAEFPMIWNVYKKGVKMVSSRSTNYLFKTQDGRKLLKDFGLTWLPFSSMLDGSYTYANIAYVKLKY